jgi:acetylglutamate kinase
MHNMHGFATPLVVKYGGNAMDDETEAALAAELAALTSEGHRAVVVHGGGPEIDRALADRGLRTSRIDGLRVTDGVVLDIAESVLCGTANKRLVRACLRAGVRAVGISGEDGGMLRARRAVSPSGGDLGYVGDIVRVDPQPLLALLRSGFVPIVAPLAIEERAGCAYNVNADTAAGAIAAALRASAYVVLTNVERVRRDPEDASTGLTQLSISEALLFATSESCQSGMRPKLLAAVEAVTGGARRAYICGAKPGAIAGALAGDATLIA